MSKKQIYFLVIFIFLVKNCLSFPQQEYNSLFKSIIKQFHDPKVSEYKEQQIEIRDISINIENGLNALNLLFPYMNKPSNIKSIVNELASFKFTLRSAKNIQLYQNAVRAVVLIIAPDIGSGTGFIIDKNKGLIITNYHVTKGLKNVLVAFYDEENQDPTKLKFYPANVFKYDAKKDIAVLKLSSGLIGQQELKLNATKKLAVGEEVHTIGHPLSLVWSYSHGLITALRKQFKFGQEESADVIQIDASISPGNSGGPLLDENGTIIGMVTFSASSDFAQNVNFAISGQEIENVLISNKNTDTQVSRTLNGLIGKTLFSLSDVITNTKAYQIDENKDGKIDYISIRSAKTNEEEYRFIQDAEIEIEKGKNVRVNILCMDINKNGMMDLILVDTDKNGKFELVLVDIDNDEEPDIIGIDNEGKGYITQAWII